MAYPLRCLQRVGCSEHEVAKTFQRLGIATKSVRLITSIRDEE